MLRQEISRRTPVGSQAARAMEQGKPVPAETALVPLRRWFWTRKPDAGFVLTDFPATLLQAKVFDEWLEARNTGLTAVLVPDPQRVDPAILDHYRTQGLDLLATDPEMN